MAGADILSDYFSRIGYRGGPRADLSTLREIHRLHPRAIPFENIDPFLGRTNVLEVERIVEKLVRSGRGGWCFEHNLLFKSALDQLGFETFLLAGRVILNQPVGSILPRHHMILGVKHAGDVYIADVGFGGLTLTAPVLLKAGVEQTTPHEAVRVSAREKDFIMEVDLGGQWVGLYSFDLREEVLPDFETANFYLSKCPDSIFRKGLVAARTGDGYRLTLRGDRVTRRSLGHPPVVRQVTESNELASILTSEFGLSLTADELQAVQTQLARQNPLHQS